MGKYQYKISCIMAVYNVAKYIDEAISSIIKQNIGFIDNVQLILVNDGSTDNSGDICDKYKAKYPNNIVVIHKENQGVAETKNLGIQYVKGEFVTFVDPDDIITKKTMKEVYNYFSKEKDKTNVVAIPIYYFEGKKGRHPLNNKFGKENELVNLISKPEAVLLSSASAYYRADILEKYKFFEELVVSEDFRLNYEIFRDKPLIGLVPKARYLYRRRKNQSSLIKTRWDNPKTYVPYMELVHMFLIRTYEEKFNRVPEFLQYALMYDLQWILSKEEIPKGILTDKEQKKYHDLISETIKNIDTNIIYRQKHLPEPYKLYALGLKTKDKKADEFLEKANGLPITIEEIKETEKALEIKFDIILPKELEELSQKLYCQINGENTQAHSCKLLKKNENMKSLNQEILNSYQMETILPIEKSKVIEIFQSYGETKKKEKAKPLIFKSKEKSFEREIVPQIKIGNKVIAKIGKDKLEIYPKTTKNILKTKRTLMKTTLKKTFKNLITRIYFSKIYDVRIKF